MSGLPLQVDQAGKRAEDLLQQHKENVAPETPPETPTPQPGIEALQKNLTDLQAKYDVLSGKYKKEIENADLKDLQRLRGENANLRREMTQLREAMAANQDLVREVKEELEKSKEIAKPLSSVAPADVNSF